jgi:hypothetical protein
MRLDLYPVIAYLPWHWFPSHISVAVDVLAAIPFAFLIRQWSTTVTAEGITIQTLHRRTIAWSEVEDIKLDVLAGDTSIDVHLRDGSRHRLPAPLERYKNFYDTEFAEKYVAIVKTWRAAAPADGRPPLLSSPPGSSTR